jgi:thioredoxin 1
MQSNKILLMIILVAMIAASFSFHKPDSAKGKGIQFFKGTFKEVLAESKKTGKPVFIDVYATWCGPCSQLKRHTFSDKEAGAYFNKNFIPFSINGETDEGKMIRELYRVDSYPTLLIIDSDARLLTKTTGFMKPYILISFGRRVIP